MASCLPASVREGGVAGVPSCTSRHKGRIGGMARNRFTSICFGIFSLLLAGTVFSYLFTRITWGQVVEVWREIDRGLVLLFVAIMLLHQGIRTWRYRIVLRAMGHPVGWLRLFLIVLVRGLCVDVLPARTGELVYIYLLRTRLGVELGAATTSFALVFLFDILALAPLLLLAIGLVGVGAGGQLSLPIVAGAAVGLGGIAAMLILLLPPGLRLGFGCSCRFLPKPSRLQHFLVRLFAAMHRDVRQARREGVYLPLFLQSLAVRALKYTGYYVLLLAMVLPQGYAVVQWPLHKVFLGLVAAEMAASLPVSGIMGFGAYQGAWTLVFALLGFPLTMAQVTSISHHVFTQVYGYAVGLSALLGLVLLRPVSGARSSSS